MISFNSFSLRLPQVTQLYMIFHLIQVFWRSEAQEVREKVFDGFRRGLLLLSAWDLKNAGCTMGCRCKDSLVGFQIQWVLDGFCMFLYVCTSPLQINTSLQADVKVWRHAFRVLNIQLKKNMRPKLSGKSLLRWTPASGDFDILVATNVAWGGRAENRTALELWESKQCQHMPLVFLSVCPWSMLFCFIFNSFE